MTRTAAALVLAAGLAWGGAMAADWLGLPFAWPMAVVLAVLLGLSAAARLGG